MLRLSYKIEHHRKAMPDSCQGRLRVIWIQGMFRKHLRYKSWSWSLGACSLRHCSWNANRECVFSRREMWKHRLLARKIFTFHINEDKHIPQEGICVVYKSLWTENIQQFSVQVVKIWRDTKSKPCQSRGFVKYKLYISKATMWKGLISLISSYLHSSFKLKVTERH